MAIATALMPPTTVIGFGLAVQNMEIAQGAGLLLATNMAAIALAAAVTAVWYGFSQDAYGHALAWELVLGAVLLLPLGVPLTNTLREVANETWMVHTARQTVQQHFSDQKMQVLGLEVSIRSGQGNRPLVQVMFASENLEDKQTEALRKSLESKLSPRADIAVAHFPFGSQPRDARTGSALVNQIGTTGMAAEAALLQPSPKDVEWSLPVLAREINPDTKSAKWVLGPSDVSLAVMRDWEAALSLRYPDWQIALIPAFQNELELSFEQGQVDTDAIDPEQLKAAVWALQRWGVTDIAIEGHASTAGRANRWLAQQRAESVRELLAVEHLAVRLQLAYPVPGQAELERRHGRKAFEKVVVRPLVRRAGSSV